MKQGDLVRGTGVGEVIRMSDWSNEVTIKITDHPDPSVIGRVYSAPKSHFEVVELEPVVQEQQALPFDERPHFVIANEGKPRTEYVPISTEKGKIASGIAEVRVDEKGAVIANSIQQVIIKQQEENKKPFWKKWFK